MIPMVRLPWIPSATCFSASSHSRTGRSTRIAWPKLCGVGDEPAALADLGRSRADDRRAADGGREGGGAGAGSHGGDPQATLAATMDGRSLAAIGDVAGRKVR